MPIINKSVPTKKDEESRIVLTLPKENRKELKDLLKEWKLIKKEMERPLDINENLSIEMWIDELYFFYYDNPGDTKKSNAIDADYIGMGSMSKKVKKQKLSDMEEILICTWNELNETGCSYYMFETIFNLEPIKTELEKRTKMHRECQIKFEKFLSNISHGVLEVVKRQSNHHLEDLFDSLAKGNTIEMW